MSVKIDEYRRFIYFSILILILILNGNSILIGISKYTYIISKKDNEFQSVAGTSGVKVVIIKDESENKVYVKVINYLFITKKKIIYNLDNISFKVNSNKKKFITYS